MNEHEHLNRLSAITQLEEQVSRSRLAVEIHRAAYVRAERETADLERKVADAKRQLDVDLALEALDPDLMRLARYALERVNVVKRLRESRNTNRACYTLKAALNGGSLPKEHGEYALAGAVLNILREDQAYASMGPRDEAYKVKERLLAVIQEENARRQPA